MHAFLLINTDPIVFAKRESTKVIPFILQKIEDSKELKKLTKFKFNEKTAIIIENIDTATTEAANAFLKNLEEPNQNLIYILTTKIQENVLPTIASRCEIVKEQSTKYSALSTHTNYRDALDIKDRVEAIDFIENLIYQDRQKNNFKHMENYLNTIKNLKLNGNVSLQLLNLVARMESHG